MPEGLLYRIIFIVVISVIIGFIERKLKSKMMKMPPIGFIILGVLIIAVLIGGAIWDAANDSAKDSASKQTRESIEYSMHTVDIEPIDIPDLSYKGTE